MQVVRLDHRSKMSYETLNYWTTSDTGYLNEVAHEVETLLYEKFIGGTLSFSFEAGWEGKRQFNMMEAV